MERFFQIFVDQFRSVSQLPGANQGQANPGAIWMWILAFLGVVGILFTLERVFKLWLVYGSVNYEKFMQNILKLTKAKEFNKAHDICKKAKGNALPYVIMRGLETISPDKDADYRTVQTGLDTAVMELMPKLQARTAYINLIASVATLIGLAGTIFGLILAFDAVGQPGIAEAQKSQMLASGISAAMGTTIGGLFIAVPTNIIYTIIIGKITKIIDDIDEWGVKFINLTQRKG